MSYCHWTGPDGVEYEIHFLMNSGEIVGYSLYPEPDFTLTREQEREIFELIYQEESYE